MHWLISDPSSYSFAFVDNKNKTDSLRTVHILMRTVMGHTAVSATEASSVTLYIRQHGAKESYSNFASFNRVVDTKASVHVIQMGQTILNVG